MKRTHYIFIAIFGILTSHSIMFVEGSTEWISGGGTTGEGGIEV